MFTRTQAQEMLSKVLKISSFPECSVSLDESEQAFVRFANNGITTAGFTIERTVTVQATRENKTGISQTTDLSADALRAAVKRAEELAAIAPPNPERMDPLGPQKYADYENFDEQTAIARSPEIVPHVKAAIEAAMAKKLVAAGFFNRSASLDAFLNSKGNFGYQRAADSRLTVTVRQPDGSSSGWAGQPSTRIVGISGAELASRAIDKCLRWKKPLRLDPGRYTVVLEPTAVGDLLSFLQADFNARATEEGRTFFSKKGGGTLLGQKLFPEYITLRSDSFDRRFPTQLWSQDNIPHRRVAWIDKGVLKNLVVDRYWARKSEAEPTPSTSSLILDGGDRSLPELIKSTERGLLVTRFWYIRNVNPQTAQVTGLTRDGVFLIEGGEVTKPVMNMRFNESRLRLLQNIKLLGKAERVQGAEGSGMIAPPVQATDFPLTSVSDAI